MKALTWHAVAKLLSSQPPGSKVRLRRSLTQHPKDGGLVPTLGLPVGQRADYRLDYGGEQVLYVQDFGTHLEARLDPRRPPVTRAAIGASSEAPDTDAMLGGAAVGGLIGLLFGRSSSSVVTGLVLGAVAGLAANAAESSPGTMAAIPKGAGGLPSAKVGLARGTPSFAFPATRALSERGKTAGTPLVAKASLVRTSLSESNPLKRALSESREVAGTPQSTGIGSAAVATSTKGSEKKGLSETARPVGKIDVVGRTSTTKSQLKVPGQPGKKGSKP
ncbi:Glycine zipper domain-containing protein [Corallococcus exiguus]